MAKQLDEDNEMTIDPMVMFKRKRANEARNKAKVSTSEQISNILNICFDDILGLFVNAKHGIVEYTAIEDENATSPNSQLFHG